MSKLFSLDSGLYKFMSRLFDMLKLNAMWILCSIPIVTIGASTTAAFTITLKWWMKRKVILQDHF